jgi:hypothetical protein
MLNMVLANANKEQNQHYPPHIFEAHYNAVAGFLLTELAEAYPSKQMIVDVAEPFLGAQLIPVIGGAVKLPEDMRNFLSASVNISHDGSSLCGKKVKEAIEIAFSTSQAKGKCRSAAVRIVDQSEWDNLTDHKYKYPTYSKPLYSVEIRYIKNEELVRYGYDMLPDDTYTFEPSLSVESQWDNNAFEYLYKGINHLYSVYTKDQDLREFSIELKKIGLI